MTPTTPLPAVGTASEHALCDFKKGISALEFHNAKDVAAFANNLGGTLLIGVAEDGSDRILSFHPLSAEEASRQEAAVAEAIKRRCRPTPLVDYARIPCGDGTFVLAINVWPSIAAPVGVTVKADKVDGFAGTALVFPVRLANQTIYLDSDHLPMHMLPELRRTLILLASIPEGALVAVVRRHHKVNVYRIKAIDETTNTLKLVGHAQAETWIPIDAVKHVFKGQPIDGASWHLGVFDWY